MYWFAANLLVYLLVASEPHTVRMAVVTTINNVIVRDHVTYSLNGGEYNSCQQVSTAMPCC